jgi:hypothetical protein
MFVARLAQSVYWLVLQLDDYAITPLHFELEGGKEVSLLHNVRNGRSIHLPLQRVPSDPSL